MEYKTLKEIADELGISKQKVYRYVKENHINEAVQDGQVKRYDEAAQQKIKSHFSNKEPHQRSTSEPHQNAIYDAVLKQLEIKDRQIADLNHRLEDMQKLLDQEQKLNAFNQQKIEFLEQKDNEPPKKKWWNIFTT
jgi:AcrR family transcriptional regulator